MSTGQPPFDLDAIEARAAAATDGPWRWMDPGGEFKQALVSDAWPTAGVVIVVPSALGDVFPSHLDAEFIAHARTDIPALVAELRRLRTAGERLAKIRLACDEIEARAETNPLSHNNGIRVLVAQQIRRIADGDD